MWRFLTTKTTMVSRDDALPGRDQPVLAGPAFHRVLGHRLDKEFDGAEAIYLAMGCFWGAERIFWQLDGVLLTSVGYMGGFTPNPTYEEVCSAQTGHAEAVKVVFDPEQVSLDEILRVFFENHDPAQGPRQGNDVGTQYRSAIYTTTAEQSAHAAQFIAEVQPMFTEKGFGQITTELGPAGEWYLAEDYHQQYLDENPNGYDCSHATGVACPVPPQAEIPVVHRRQPHQLRPPNNQWLLTMPDDLRDDLRASLFTDWSLELLPRGGNLDVMEIVTDRGFCASPVTVRLPLEWVSQFAKDESIHYLATLIAEAIDTDTTTQLEEIVVTHDWLRRPVVKPIRT